MWVIRQDRHGPPDRPSSLIVPTWPIGEDEVLIWCGREAFWRHLGRSRTADHAVQSTSNRITLPVRRLRRGLGRRHQVKRWKVGDEVIVL